MTDEAQGTGASSDTPQTQKRQPKGNQLEGKRADTLSLRQASAKFENSIIGDIAKSDTLADDGKPKPNTKQPAKVDPKGHPKREEATQTEADGTDDLENDDDGYLTDDGDPEGNREDEADEFEEGDELSDDENSSEDDLHTVTVNGKKEKVSYEELVKGYTRMADYTEKTMDLSRERQELEVERQKVADLPKVREAYERKAAVFTENAGLVLKALEGGFIPQEPAEALKISDPALYIEQKEARQKAIQFYHGVKNQMTEIQAQAQANHVEKVNEGRVKLLQIQPDLNKPEVRGMLQKYINKAGYTDEQVRSEADHRLFDFAYKAMLWDDMIERRKNAKPEKPRSKVLSQTAAREDGSTVSQRKKSEAQAAHKRTHSVKSASDALTERIMSASKNRR